MRIFGGVLPFGLFLIGGLASASAGTVKIEQANGPMLTVVAEGATVSEVVGKLGEAYGFRLDHKGGSKPADPSRDDQFGLDGRYEGSLRAVLERILDKESYFIEHAPRSKSGIARVVLYHRGSSQAAAASGATPAAAVAPAPVAPAPVAAVPRYLPPAPAVPAMVPPVRRVQPAQPAAPARPTVATPPTRAALTPGQAVSPGQASPAANAAAPQARKRGGVIQ
jgi:hypothetical protein